jgi:hypothetical protein
VTYRPCDQFLAKGLKPCSLETGSSVAQVANSLQTRQTNTDSHLKSSVAQRGALARDALKGCTEKTVCLFSSSLALTHNFLALLAARAPLCVLLLLLLAFASSCSLVLSARGATHVRWPLVVVVVVFDVGGGVGRRWYAERCTVSVSSALLTHALSFSARSTSIGRRRRRTCELRLISTVAPLSRAALARAAAAGSCIRSTTSTYSARVWRDTEHDCARIGSGARCPPISSE